MMMALHSARGKPQVVVPYVGHHSAQAFFVGLCYLHMIGVEHFEREGISHQWSLDMYVDVYESVSLCLAPVNNALGCVLL